MPALGAFLIRRLADTMSMSVSDPAGILKTPSDQAFVLAFWHNRILILLCFYERYLAPRRMFIMVSTSRDGQWIADIVEQFGMLTSRGSSSKKAVKVSKQILDHLAVPGTHAGLTPDGPRGPKYKAQMGVVMMAKHSGVPIVPLTCRTRDKWEMKSWDAFQIPKFFTSCEFILGEPIPVAKDAGREEMEEARLKLERALGGD